MRTLHFAEALKRAGFDPRILLLQDAPLPVPREWKGNVSVPEEGTDWIERARTLAEDADVLVGAGPYNPSRLACLIAGERPVWADIPGDPLAEFQALERAAGTMHSERKAAAIAALLPVLNRADAISTVSERQSLATIGQLHLLDRRAARNPVPVHTIPIAYHMPFPSQEPSPTAPMRVALVGAFNSWLDHLTLIEGVEQALESRDTIEFCCIGGKVPGMETGAAEALEKWSRTSRHRSRIHLHGWVPQSELPELLRNCRAGIWMDRKGDEPLLGSRTRALLYGWMGLRILGTPSTEMARDMASAGHLTPIPVGDASALSRALVTLEPEHTDLSLRRKNWLRDRYSTEHTTRALRDWIHQPRRVPTTNESHAALAEDHARLRDELQTMQSSRTWRTLSAAHRALRRTRDS